METMDKQGVLDQVILGIAHELNNPNAFVRMNSLNLKKMFWLLRPCLEEYACNHPDARLGPYPVEEFRLRFNQQLESILEATVRIIGIADRLKQCTTATLECRTRVSLTGVLADTVAGHRFILDRSTRLEMVLDRSMECPLNGYRLQLEQAFSILLGNACDAMVERFGDRAQEEGRLQISIADAGEFYLITFSDNGCGMSPETLGKVFVPYFTTKPQGMGEGLGLPICRSILQRHQGRIDISSRENEGTDITITLPISKGTNDGEE